MNKLLEKLDECIEITKDYDTIRHLFSDDKGVEALAKLHQSAGQIRYLVELSEIKEIGYPKNEAIRESRDTGSLVKVRPCSKEFEDKTFIGVMIGDAALSSCVSIEENKIVCSWAHYNPAILIPDIGKIVYGCGSWWGRIKSESDLKDISDMDIDNIWYVKALKQIAVN